SKTLSCASCTATTPWRCWHEHTRDAGPADARLGLPDPAAQRAPALLEGRLPDHRGARPHGPALPAGVRPRARRPGASVRLHSVYLLPDPGADDDEHAAKCLRQPVFVADTKPHHGQPGVRAAAATVTSPDIQCLPAGRHCARALRGPGD